MGGRSSAQRGNKTGLGPPAASSEDGCGGGGAGAAAVDGAEVGAGRRAGGQHRKRKQVCGELVSGVRSEQGPQGLTQREALVLTSPTSTNPCPL